MTTAAASTGTGIASDALVNHQMQVLEKINKETDGTINAAFADMIAAVMPSAAAFRSAYTKEQQRIASQNAPEGEETASKDQPVSLHWLQTSGYLDTLLASITRNMQTASVTSDQATASAAISAYQEGRVTAGAQVAQASGTDPNNMQYAPPLPDTVNPNLPANVQMALLSGDDTSSPPSPAPAQVTQQAQQGILSGAMNGLSGQALMLGLQTVLGGALSAALGAGRNAATGGMAQAVTATITNNGLLVNGWMWLCLFDDSCQSCMMMDGTFHGNDETLDSHKNCQCQMVPYSGPPPDGSDIQTGEQWLMNDATDAELQQLLGPSKYMAYKSGDVQLMDLVTKEGGFYHERSLKSLGLDFRDYLMQRPTASELRAPLDIPGPHPIGGATLTSEEKALLDAVREQVAELPGLPEIKALEPGNTMGYQITDKGGAGAARIQELVGHDMTPDEIGGMVGAQAGNEVTVVANDDGSVSFHLHADAYDANRTLYQDRNGLLVMNNDNIKIHDPALRRQGLGATIFGEQVQQLTALGVDRIEIAAVRDGIIAWARFGYQTSLADLVDEGLDLGALHEAFPGVETLQDLMLQPGGPEWWRANGVSFRGTFDLKEGSISHQILDAYLQEKGIVLEGVQAAETPEPPEVPNAAPAAPAPPITVAGYTLPEIDQQAEDQVVQAAKDALGGDGIASHTDAIALGAPIDDYIDQRAGPLAEWHQEASSLREMSAKKDYSQLTADMRAWISGDTSAHGGLTIQEVEQQYAAVRQSETLRLLQQARDVGGVDLSIASGGDQAVADALQQVQDVFPSDWLTLSNEQGDLLAGSGAASREGLGYYAAQPNGLGRIGLRVTEGMTDEQKQFIAIHELGHRMEDAVPGLWQMERDFYEARTVGEEYVALTNGIKAMTKLDEWTNQYFGRKPIPMSFPGANGVLRRWESYELLSNGLQYVLSDNPIGYYYLQQDQEFWHFILGILFGAKGTAA